MKNEFEIKGVVDKVIPTDKVSINMDKKVIVIEAHAGSHYQFIPIDFINDNITCTEGVQKGDFVTILFQLKGRYWKDKVFSSLEGLNLIK